MEDTTTNAANTPIDPKVVARIQKMLNLAKDGGATEAEAAAAAEMAAKTMRKHNLTMAQVEAGGGASGEKRAKQQQKGRAQYEFQQQLMLACAEVNFCMLLRHQEYRGRTRLTTGFTIIGREANVAATQGLFDYLMTTVERLAFEYVGCDNRQRLSRVAVSFKEGAAVRLAERIRARHQQALEEQAREARERNAVAKHPASTGTALVVSLRDFAQEEKDRNEDFRRGLPEGTTAQRRRDNELESRLIEAANAALKEDVIMDRAALMEMASKAVAHFNAPEKVTRAAVEQAVWAKLEEQKERERLAKETPAQKAKREAREAREARAYWNRYWREQDARAARRDPTAYRDGERAGDRVGLDKQVDKGQPSKGQLNG